MCNRHILLAAMIFCVGGGVIAPPSFAETPPLYGPTTPAFAPPLPELRYAQIPAARRAAFSGDRFSYIEAGPTGAPVVLLLHGGGGSAAIWRLQYNDLKDRYRVIGWNAPGYMLTDALKEETPSCRDYADAVAALLEALEIAQVYLVGNSFGSAVAQCFAATYPDRVRKLALTGALSGRGDEPAEKKGQMLAAMNKVVADGGMTYGLSGGREVYLTGPQTSQAVRTMLQSVLVSVNPRGFMQGVRFIANLPSTVRLADRLTMPVLIIQGSADKVSPAETDAIPIKAALRDARLVMLEGYGHLPELEAHDKVNELLKEFFQ